MPSTVCMKFENKIKLKTVDFENQLGLSSKITF